MNEHVTIDAAAGNSNRLRIIDCDVHPRIHSPLEFKPFLSARAWDLWQTYGTRNRHGFAKGHPYPKSQPDSGMRRDHRRFVRLQMANEMPSHILDRRDLRAKLGRVGLTEVSQAVRGRLGDKFDRVRL